MLTLFRHWFNKIRQIPFLKRQTVAQATILLTVLAVASKPLGMVREFIIARYFGATAAKDAFVIANNVPAIFGLLIAAFLNVFLPVFIRIREQKGEIEAWRLGSKVFTVLFLLVIASSA